MWSNFAARAQQPTVSTGAPPAVTAPPLQQREEQQQQQQPPEKDDSSSSNADNNTGDGDAWSDDDIILEDELFDDVNVDGVGTEEDNDGVGTNEGDNDTGISKSSSAGLVGGIGGWGASTLKSFTQHEPLNLSSFGGASSPAPPAPANAATSSTTAPAQMTENETANADANGGWDDEDDLNFNESIEEITPKKEAVAAPKLTPLGRAAEHFGAALLASMDNEEEEDDEGSYTDNDHDDADDRDGQEEDQGKVGGGFGGGFVMKGLSRFIEAATAPQQHEEESQETPMNDGGWGEDDDDLDFHDDDDDNVVQDGAAGEEVVRNDLGNVVISEQKDPTTVVVMKETEKALIEPTMPDGGDLHQPPDLQDELPMMMEETTGDGWDEDIDIAFDSPPQPKKTVVGTSTTKPVDSGKNDDDNGDVSVSIKDLVAMTESAMDSEFDGMWKTPPPKKGTTMATTMESSANNRDDIMNESMVSSIVDEFSGAPKVAGFVEPSTAAAVVDRPTLPKGGDLHPPDHLQGEPPAIMETTGDDGWGDEDDIDITFDTPQPKEPADSPKPTIDSGKSSDHGEISDAIKDLVAMTELALDSEFDGNMWKTPPPKMGTSRPSALMSLNEGNDEIVDDSMISSDMDDFLGEKVVSPVLVEPSATAVESYANNGKHQDAANNIENNDENAVEAEVEKEDVLSKSLTDFVDNFDAELNDLYDDKPTNEPTSSKPTATTTTTTAAGESYSYDENKDDSPEPLPQQRSPQPPIATTITESVKSLPALPHQESWYLNAMEGGKGGVVYVGDQVLDNAASKQLHPPPIIPKGQLIGEDAILKQQQQQQSTLHNQQLPPLVHILQGGGDVVANDMSLMIHGGCSTIVVPRPSSTVGMPLSEMPSGTNSKSSSPRASPIMEDGNPADDDADLKHSELQCKCLELIMPLPPNNANNDEEKKSSGSPARGEQSGFGTKKLPDGTSVLVNYEKLLQNEATKRILLQRSVEAYEHGLQQLQSQHQSSMNTMQEQEIQLAAAHCEIDNLKEMVMRLQDEKENMVTETQLFEAELSSALQDKDYLEKEVETVQEDAKVKLNNMESSLQESNDEKMRLIDQVEVLQCDMAEVQKERDFLTDKVQECTTNAAAETEELKSLVESLEEELFEKNNELEQLNDQVSIKPLPDSLKNDLSEMKVNLSRVRDENIMLRAMQREYDVQITELKATVESMDCDSAGEVDKLAAEVASITYELCMKKTECEETKSALKAMQVKRERAEVRLAEYKSIAAAAREEDNHSAGSSRTEQSFSAGENGLLYKNLADLQVACSSLESQKSELETRLEDKAKTIRGLETRIKKLNVQVMQSSPEDNATTLQEELVQVKKSLDDKVAECEQFASAMQLLQTKLNDVEAKLVVAASNAAALVEGNNQSSSISEAEKQSLRAENGMLTQQVSDLRAANSLLEVQQLGLEKNFEERATAVQGLETQIQDLKAKAMQTDNNHWIELSDVRNFLNDKVDECETMASSCEQLQTELLNVQSDRDAIIAKSQESADNSQEKISWLQSQVTDLLKDHNVTMRSVEEQLTNSLEQCSTLHAQCEEYRVKLEEAEKECANMSRATSDTIAKYTQHISRLQGENLDLTTALQTAQLSLEAQQLAASEDDPKVMQLQKSLDAMKQEMDSIAYLHQELIDKNHCLMQEKAEIVRSLEARASTAEQRGNVLQLECAKLRSNLDITEKASSEAQEAVANLNEQMQTLKDSNAQLEDKLFEASFESPEANALAEENASLRKERDELKEEALALSQRITELASDAGSLATSLTSVEKEALLARINTLEAEAKAEKLDELRDEITSLHEERQELDLDNEELLVQLGLMQQDKFENQAEIELELESLREQVSSLQDQCTRLQNDLDESRSSCSVVLPGNEKDIHVKILQDDNHSLHQTISQLNGENESLMEQINILTQKIQELEMHISQVGNGGDTDHDELKALRQKIDLLELKLTDNEVEVESAKKEMNLALDNRDLEIFKLATECSSKEKELKEVSSKLEAANNEMGCFNSQLDTLQSQYDQVQKDQVDGDGGAEEEEKFYEDDDDDISLQDLLAEAVLDSDDYLRSQIVVLAQALERSELQRADALERIFSERKINSHSLRQLGESVKRFYTTVR